MYMRTSGVLLPVASLPSKYGIGSFSEEAYRFVDFLALASQTYWQVLPMGPTGYGDSPYQSFSTYAGNPYFIDLEELASKGWLTKRELSAAERKDLKIDYEKIYLTRFKLLKKAYERSGIEKDPDYAEFVKENAFWLEDYALFMAIKEEYRGKAFSEWEEKIRLHKKEAIKTFLADEKNVKTSGSYRFMQYLFYRQWEKLKAYANEKGIKIIGDIPIYVAFDSADTWANPELFRLDKKNVPLAVAGCPPDYFSATGQLWGNPLYRWEYHKETGYAWWLKRLEFCYKLYDVVRIDHFRGFDEYYSIPYGDPTAEFGHWEKGPGYELFDEMKKKLGKRPIIAEDLGFLTPSVLRLVKKCGYPGMKILEFAFDSSEDNDYLPHNYEKNCVVYTGTHDNDTVFGWYSTLKKKDRDYLKEYLGCRNAKNLNWDLIRLAMSSVADTCIIPMQDYLGLGSEARINTPSVLGGNWDWRMPEGALTDELAEKIKNISAIYGRN